MPADVLEESCRALEKDAFNALFSQHRDVAVTYAYSILRNRADAEDATQTAFLMAWLRRSHLSEPGAFACWLRSAVRAESYRIIRQARLVTVPLDDEPPVADVLIGYLTHQNARLELIDAIKTLSSSDRSLITLRYMAGLGYRDLCRCLDVPLTTVKNRLHEARRRLRVRMTLVASETSARQKLLR